MVELRHHLIELHAHGFQLQQMLICELEFPLLINGVVAVKEAATVHSEGIKLLIAIIGYVDRRGIGEFASVVVTMGGDGAAQVKRPQRETKKTNVTTLQFVSNFLDVG